MLRETRRLAQAVGAISKHEFLDALSPWPELLRDGKARVGLAVSGGVDSMALTAMMKHYTGCRLTALVIDHGLRKESKEEAARVAINLRTNLDVHTLVRTSADLKEEDGDCRLNGTGGIETVARRLRYRLLGRACAELGIRRLLVAHHQGDRYETVLLRLCRNHLFRLGPQRAANLPDCYGIYGLYQSGGTTSESAEPLTNYNCGVNGIERPSITLLRPLLHFPKSRLVETCRQLNVPWVEDGSNEDATLTGRNALRHVLKKHQLPEALQVPAVLELVTEIEDRAAGWEKAALALLDRCSLKLDVRSGSVMIWIPDDVLASLTEAVQTGWTIGALFVQRAQYLAHRSGKSSLRNSDLARFVSFLGEPSKHAITTNGVMITRINLPKAATFQNGDQATSFQGFLIHRKPPFESELKLQKHDLAVPPGRTAQGFRFWDSRYWISILNPSTETLHIRFFQPSHLKVLKRLLSHDKISVYEGAEKRCPVPNGTEPWDRRLSSMLKAVASGKIIWTLPVIECLHHGQPIPIALPTLGWSFLAKPGADWPDWVGELRWDVRYMSVELGKHAANGSIVGLAKSSDSPERHAGSLGSEELQQEPL